MSDYFVIMTALSIFSSVCASGKCDMPDVFSTMPLKNQTNYVNNYIYHSCLCVLHMYVLAAENISKPDL